MYDSTKTKCIDFLKKSHDSVLQCKVPGHQRTLQAGRKLRMSLDQPLAQGRLRHVIRPEHSGLGPNGFLKPPRTETTQPLWTVFTAWLPSWKTGFFLSTVCFSLVSVNTCWVSPSHHALLPTEAAFSQALQGCSWPPLEAASTPGWIPIIYQQQAHNM